MSGKSKDVHNLSSLLGVLAERIDGDRSKGSGEPSLTVADVLDLIGRRAYGPLLLIVGLISISPAALIPGSTWAFAALILLISVQLALHKDRPWMPKAALKMKLSEEKLGKFIKGARPTARVIDKIVKPRWSFLAKPPWVIAIAVLCMLAALVTFPLGLIPIAPLAPGLAVVLFGLGLTARDGVLLSIGAAVIGGAFGLVFWRVL